MKLSRRQMIIGATALPITSSLAVPLRAAVAPVYAEKGIAIDGSDAVAYFIDGAPTKGRDTLTMDWMGATWRFANEENRKAFAKNPAAFAPQYGGYCAWAVSEGYTAPTDPRAWKIVDGKLYLNYSRRIQRKWERDIPGRIASGDANWPKLIA